MSFELGVAIPSTQNSTLIPHTVEVAMVDVLLAHSYFLKYDDKQFQKMRPYAPLATLYAASLLRSKGYTVALFDAMLSDGEHEFEQALQRHQPRYAVLYEDNFNFLSKMCLS